MSRHFSTLVELLQNSLQDYPDRELFGEKQPDGSWSWMHFREFGVLVDQARAGLAQLGIQKGDRVALVSNNRSEWAVMAFASYGLGACIVPMYEAQKPSEWSFILDDCGAKLAVGATNQIYEKLKSFQQSSETLEFVIGLELASDEPDSFQRLLALGRESPHEVADISSDDLAGFVYTSGTTGNPKGVKLSHGNFSKNALHASARFDFNEHDRSLAFLPWAHVFGFTAELTTFIHVGACMAINDAVPNLITNLPVVRPTVLVAVPRIFNRIYDGVNKQMVEKPGVIRKLFRAGVAAASKKNGGTSLGFVESTCLSMAEKLIFSKVRQKFGGRLRFVVSGSAALSTQVAEFIDSLGIDVYEGYGLTETSPVITINYKNNRKIGSVGKCIEGVSLRIDHSATGKESDGEVIVMGHNVMQGYHNRDDENSKVFCEDGALRTGDMGHIDDDGYLFITGRIKEQYKLENGKYVVPSPLEEDLKLSPLIANIMLHGANRRHNVAILVPDLAALEKQCTKEGIVMDNIESSPQIKELLQKQVEKFARNFKSYEVPRNLLITLEDFTADNDMLTPSMKIKRRNILARYGEQLNALYEQPAPLA